MRICFLGFFPAISFLNLFVCYALNLAESALPSPLGGAGGHFLTRVARMACILCTSLFSVLAALFSGSAT